MRLLHLVVVMGLAVMLGCGTTPPIGACTTPVATDVTTADGGTVSCLCEGPCGCFFADGGRCP